MARSRHYSRQNSDSISMVEEAGLGHSTSNGGRSTLAAPPLRAPFARATPHKALIEHWLPGPANRNPRVRRRV